MITFLLVALSAHDLYLMPQNFVVKPGQQLRIVYQNGEGFPDAPAVTKPERLRNTQLLSRTGTVKFEKIAAEEKYTTATVAIPGTGSMILTSNTAPNSIEFSASEFEAYLAEEGLQHIIAWRKANNESERKGSERYSKYAKSILQSSASDSYYKERTGLPIEIIPESNPYSLKPGASMMVQVLFKGAPAKDVAIESAYLEAGKAKIEIVGRTDAKGRVRVPIKAIGPHKLHALVMERCVEPKVADWESFWASLTFEIQPKSGN